MTATTYIDAVDDMFATFKATWDAGIRAIDDNAQDPRYMGKIEANAPDASRSWVRVGQQTVLTRQVAVSASNSNRRDETSGLVSVQVFVPIGRADGLLLARRIATLCRKAFLRTSISGTVWFRRARVIELTPDGAYFRMNVVAEYEYDELN